MSIRQADNIIAATYAGGGFVGMIVPGLCTNVPDGYLLCNGQAVSRTTYSALFAEIGTTFGEGDGSTTFNLPDLRSRFVKGKEDSETMGQLNEAGLPNITGTFSEGGNAGDTATGAFYVENPIGQSNQGIASDGKLVGFDASRSSAIYGESDTVTPKNISVNWYIKY